MTAEDLSLRIRLLDARLAQEEARKTDKAIAKIGGSARKAGKDAKEGGKGFGVFSSAMSGFKWTAGVAGLGSLAFGIKDVVNAGQQWQQQQAQLRNAVLNTHQAVMPNMKLLNNAIDQSSTHGGFSPQEEAQGLAQFTRLTGSASTALYYQSRALDLARGAHLDYQTAVKMESQIYTGNTGRLQKYLGIIQPVKSLVEGMTAAEKLANPQKLKENELLDKRATATLANKMVLQKYGNATQEYSKTTAGALSNASHAWDLINERLGKVFLPYVSDAANALANVALEIDHGQGIWGGLGKDVSEVGGAFKTLGQDAEGVYKFLEQHKDIAKVLGFASGGGLVAHLANHRGKSGAAKLVEDAGKSARYGNLDAIPFAAGAALLPATASAIHAAVEGLSPGYLKDHSLKDITTAIAGGGKGLYTNAHGVLEPSRGFAHTQAGGKAVPVPHNLVKVYDRALHRDVTVHPGETLPGPPIHVHLHLDGKQIAESTVRQVRDNAGIARPVAEGVTQYAKTQGSRK